MKLLFPATQGPPDRRFARGRSGRAALSLVETLLSVVLVGGLIAVSLNLVGASAVGNQKSGDRSRGQLLAEALASEILMQAYANPDGAPLWGLEVGESNASRTTFDDVDDYDGWTESPPTLRDGTVLADFGGWSRSVAVAWVDADNLNQPILLDEGVKRVTITVRHNGVPAATRTVIRTDEGPSGAGPSVITLIYADPEASLDDDY